jgi:hypothetical protein
MHSAKVEIIDRHTFRNRASAWIRSSTLASGLSLSGWVSRALRLYALRTTRMINCYARYFDKFARPSSTEADLSIPRISYRESDDDSFRYRELEAIRSVEVSHIKMVVQNDNFSKSTIHSGPSREDSLGP